MLWSYGWGGKSCHYLLGMWRGEECKHPRLHEHRNVGLGVGRGGVTNEGARDRSRRLLPAGPATDCVVLGESSFPLGAHISIEDNVTCLSFEEKSYEHHRTEHM